MNGKAAAQLLCVSASLLFKLALSQLRMTLMAHFKLNEFFNSPLWLYSLSIEFGTLTQLVSKMKRKPELSIAPDFNRFKKIPMTRSHDKSY